MKVINIYIDSLKFGGIEKNLVTILNHLDKRKYYVNLIFLNRSVGQMYEQIEFPVHTIFLNHKELSMKKLVIFSNVIKFIPKGVFRSLWKIPKADIEIIFPERIVPIFANKLMAHKKLSWFQTSVNPSQKLIYYQKNIITKWIYWWSRKSYQRLDFVICNSEMCKAQFEEVFQLKNKAIAIPGYIDNTLIRKKAFIIEPQIGEGFIVITVCRLSKEKNILLLLEAFLIVKDKVEAKLVIIGDGPERVNIERFIEMHNLSREVFVLGYQENPYCYIAKSSVLVSSSCYEGLGLTALEAMTLGVPVVSVHNGGMDEIIDSNKYGILTEATPEDLAEAILKVFSNPVSECANLMSRAYQYDIEKQIVKIEGLFE